MRIEAARLEGAELILTLPSPAEARRLVYRFKPGEYELEKAVKKRSMDANAYCWVLCQKIAAAVGAEKEDVYRNAIQGGNECVMFTVPDEDYESFCRAWSSRGIGWRVQLVDDAGLGSKVCYAYYGSSVYDTKAMARLIDDLISDAKALDIETLPPDELAAMMEAWDAQANKGAHHSKGG